MRALCAGLPETTETGSWGHPNFRAGGKTFAAYEYTQGRPAFAFKLDAETAARLAPGARFFPTPYGRGAWQSLWADEPYDGTVLRGLVLESWRRVALKRMLAALERAGGPDAGG